MLNVKRTLGALAVIGATPLIAMSSSPARYVDAAFEVPMPVCNLETCDPKDGHCEFDRGYHVPDATEEMDVAVATEVVSGGAVMLAAASE